MLDLKWVRDNPDALDDALKRRHADPLSAELLSRDAERRAVLTELQDLQERRNSASREVGELFKSGKAEQANVLKEEVAGIKTRLQELEQQERDLGAAVDGMLAAIPNIPADDVPEGEDEDQNEELRRIGTPRHGNEGTPDHVAIGEELGLMDFEAAAKLSGSRFVVLRGQLARLERALGQFMLDTHTSEFGYTEMSPPLLVRDHVLFGTGQLPKFEEDQFKTNTDHYLIPTAEVPLTNLVANSILSEEELPLRMTAMTPCFRSEAGAAGKDTRGMIRQHQFWKVELVSITADDTSVEEHERMIGAAEHVLQKLDLAYRVVNLCTGDLGFSATKTYDIEVWLPGQMKYREISSCSNCLDFQARRMKARYRKEGEKQTRFVHTLNGSGVAVGRALIAVMENYRNEDGSITVPEVLRPYMGGLEVIRA
ncbi:MAG: serine--tRNA ligase [Alphaproteobacteria bacterium]